MTPTLSVRWCSTHNERLLIWNGVVACSQCDHAFEWVDHAPIVPPVTPVPRWRKLLVLCGLTVLCWAPIVYVAWRVFA